MNSKSEKDIGDLFRIDTEIQLLLLAFKSKFVRPLLVQYIHSGNVIENTVREALKAFLSQCCKSESFENFNLGDPVCNEAIIDFAINTILKRDGLFYLLAHRIPFVNRIKSLQNKISKGSIEKYLENLQSSGNDIDLQSTYGAITTHFRLSSTERVLLKLTFDGKRINVSDFIHPDMKFSEIFSIAVICGSISILDTIWNHEANLEPTKSSLAFTNSELTALHFAVLTGNTNVVDWLLRKEFMMEAVDQNGDTGLHLAASAGIKEIVEMLLNRGSSCNACNANKKTPLHKAAEGGHSDIVDVLIRDHAKIEPQNASGNTPLIGAVENGHRHVVQQLLNYGAAIYARNSKDNSCLHRAAFHGYSELVELLLSRGPENIDAQNSEGKTALHIAAERGHLNVVSMLLVKNADINCQNQFGQTALHEAAWKGHTSVAELLLKHGASVEITDGKNRTALHEAASNGFIAIVELLLNCSNINAVDHNNDTALQLAQKFEKNAIVELLQKKLTY